jgi:L-ribulose-5-phosphate 4-epimerase
MADDRALEILAFRDGVVRAAAGLETWCDRQETLAERLVFQGYKEVLLEDAWSRRACALIDTEGFSAGTAAVKAAGQVAGIMSRSDDLRERAGRLESAARWLAGRLDRATGPELPPDAILAAADLSPLELLDLQRPALIAGPEPSVRSDGVLVWGVPGLGPDWHGRRVTIDGPAVMLDLPDSRRTGYPWALLPCSIEASPGEDAPMLYEEARKAVCDAAKRMQRDGLVKLTSGNISCRVPGTGFFAITPSGMDYDTLLPGDVCILDTSGKVINGHRRPSTETPMHRACYERRPDVGGIVHTHSIYASAFACLGKEMPIISTELAMLVGGTIKCAPYAKSGTEEFARAAVDTLGSESLAVLFQNHGVMAVGRTLKEAYSVAVGLEEAAMIYHIARQLGDPIMIPAEERDRMFREYRQSYGQPRPGQSREPGSRAAGS